METVVDHVIICVPDLESSVDDFEERYGVSSVAGGRHRGHGTANRLVPLGDTYLELAAVVDPDEAARSAFGEWVASRSRHPGAHGLAVRADDFDAVCTGLGLEPLAMSRPAVDGEELRWRVAGMEQLVTAGLPFFIEWEIDPAQHPGRIPASHARGDLALADVVVRGDLGELRRWVGEIDGVSLEQGDPSIEYTLVPH